jgi:hypothetical protein
MYEYYEKDGRTSGEDIDNMMIAQIGDIKEFFWDMVDYNVKAHLHQNDMMYLSVAALMTYWYFEADAYVYVNCAEIFGGVKQVTHRLVRRLHRGGF